jgi:hypothetical protein
LRRREKNCSPQFVSLTKAKNLPTVGVSAHKKMEKPRARSKRDHEWKHFPSLSACADDPRRASRDVEKSCRFIPSALQWSQCRTPRCFAGVREPVVSPTYGTVVCADARRGIITIYLAQDDIHKVFAPLSGRVVHLQFCQGKIFRPELLFVADAHKDGRAIVTVQHPTDVCVEFWLEVGHGSYITDRVRLSQGNQTLEVDAQVHKGRQVGEILLGSLAEVHLPMIGDSIAWRLHVRKGDRVVGGKTVLATWQCA